MANGVPTTDPLNQQWAGEIFRRNFASLPYQAPGNPSPIEEMLGMSSIVDAARQALPGRLGGTKAGQWLFDAVAGESDAKSARTKAARLLADIPLGGYETDYMRQFDVDREFNAQTRLNSQRLGFVPAPDGVGEVSTKGRPDLAAVQTAGLVTGDLMSDGLRNIWWFLNAPQALTTLAVLQAVNMGGNDFFLRGPGRRGTDFRDAAGIEYGTLLKNPKLRFAAAAPAWMAMSAAVGSGARLPGYSAAVPSEEDRTKTADPVAEVLSRFFLGRSGSLLPYEEFVKERPDVSRAEYDAYKQYLFGDRSPLKFTTEGIHGPEVTFLGKSVPIATGVLPALAGVVGAGYGVNRAARRLYKRGSLGAAKEAGKKYHEELQKLKELESRLFSPAISGPERAHALSEAKRMRRFDELPDDWQQLNSVVDEYRNAYRKQELANDFELTKDALLYGSGGIAGTAALGYALESLRRAMPDPSTAQPQGQTVS